MYPSPAPPYCSGKITPSSPISPSLGMISMGKYDASSHSITCGPISPSANSRTLRRSCCCSSVNANSTVSPIRLWSPPILSQIIIYITALLLARTSRKSTVPGLVRTPTQRATILSHANPLSGRLPPMRRRHFLTLSAATLGGVLLYSLDRHATLLASQRKPVRIPLRFFTEKEALIIAAAASRIFPSDDSGPGAREAGVAIYIDRQLAGAYGRDRFRYTQPPFEDATHELGYQGKETPRQIYRDGLKNLMGFHLLPPAGQDEALQKIESTLFFSLLRQN